MDKKSRQIAKVNLTKAILDFWKDTNLEHKHPAYIYAEMLLQISNYRFNEVYRHGPCYVEAKPYKVDGTGYIIDYYVDSFHTETMYVDFCNDNNKFYMTFYVPHEFKIYGVADIELNIGDEYVDHCYVIHNEEVWY